MTKPCKPAPKVQEPLNSEIGKEIGNKDTWESLKKDGSGHYKSAGKVEPIDLYRSLGAFRHFAICSIIKYAARNVNAETHVSDKDMGKVIHYAKLLMAEKAGEGEHEGKI